MAMIHIFQNKNLIFQIGLISKIVLILLLAPTIQDLWFVDFVKNSIEHPSLNPWESYLNNNGQLVAFPYGIVMLAVHTIPVLVGSLIDSSLSLDYFSSLGFRLSLLFSDLILLIILLKLFKENQHKVLLYYWLSPLAIFITYWHGQTDIIPITFFVLSLLLIKERKYTYAGICFALAVNAKYSMLIGLPFILLYLFQNKSLRQYLPAFTIAFIGVSFLTVGPFLFSEAFRVMVISTDEANKIFRAEFNLDNNVSILFTLLTYTILLYYNWRLNRISFELLISVIGASYSIIVLLTLAPPGWFFWLIPFYVAHQIRSGTKSVFLIGILTLLFIIFHLTNSSGSEIPLFGWQGFENLSFNFLSIKRFDSIIYTLLIASGVLITIQIIRHGIHHNDYYKISRRPLSIGIAGNTCSGKNTLAISLTKLFGVQSVARLSEDDYVNWDRFSPMWKTVTHLDPRANQLFKFANDVLSLIAGTYVKERKYNNITGLFTKLRTLRSENIIIVTGLHSLYPLSIRSVFDVKFFLEIEEKLYTYIKVHHNKLAWRTENEILESITKNMPDYLNYVKPQEIFANVSFKLHAINIDILDRKKINSLNHNLKLEIKIKNGIYYKELVRALVGICGLLLNVSTLDAKGEVIIEIQGDVTADDIQLAVKMLLPHIEELLDINPEWENGISGIMQLVALVEINELLKIYSRQPR